MQPRNKTHQNGRQPLWHLRALGPDPFLRQGALRARREPAPVDHCRSTQRVPVSPPNSGGRFMECA
eukprot:54866-Rhodomonas_salina.1